VLAYYLAEVLEDTGVTNLVRPLSTEDFTDMD
jgi:energy-coupling factor transport system substrate-specific component